MVQTAIFAPRVVGIAICPRVRAAISVSRWRAACAASAAISRSSRPSSTSSAAASRRTRPVSMTSCVVSPQWAHRACSAGSRRRSAATSAGTGVPEAATPGASSAGSISAEAAASAIVAALDGGIMPSAPWTRAAAPSTASIARISAVSAKSGPISGSPQKPAQSAASKGETAIRRASARGSPGPPPAVATGRAWRAQSSTARRTSAALEGASVARSSRMLSSSPVRVCPPPAIDHAFSRSWSAPMPAPHQVAPGASRVRVSM